LKKAIADAHRRAETIVLKAQAASIVATPARNTIRPENERCAVTIVFVGYPAVNG
jgi:hypothetical protein